MTDSKNRKKVGESVEEAGASLKKLVLYGSIGRGEETENSLDFSAVVEEEIEELLEGFVTNDRTREGFGKLVSELNPVSTCNRYPDQETGGFENMEEKQLIWGVPGMDRETAGKVEKLLKKAGREGLMLEEVFLFGSNAMEDYMQSNEDPVVSSTEFEEVAWNNGMKQFYQDNTISLNHGKVFEQSREEVEIYA